MEYCFKRKHCDRYIGNIFIPPPANEKKNGAPNVDRHTVLISFCKLSRLPEAQAKACGRLEAGPSLITCCSP